MGLDFTKGVTLFIKRRSGFYGRKKLGDPDIDTHSTIDNN